MATPKIYTTAGDHSADNLGAFDQVLGSAGDDTIKSHDAPATAQTIYGGAGNDSITGVHAADKLYGEAGNDTLVGANGGDATAAQNALVTAQNAEVTATTNKNLADLADAAKAAVAAVNTALTELKANYTVLAKQTAFEAAVATAITAMNAATVAGADPSGAQAKIDLAAVNSALTTLKAANYGNGSGEQTATEGAMATSLNSANTFGDATDATSLGLILSTAQLDVVTKQAAVTAALLGSNYLDGGIGNDVLVAGTKGDTLVGGLGNDALTLAAGNDTVVFNAGDGHDTVTGFAVASDKIKLNVNADQVQFTVAAGKVTKVAVSGADDITFSEGGGLDFTAAGVGAITTKDNASFVFANVGGPNAVAATDKYVIATNAAATAEYFGTEKLVDATNAQNNNIHTNSVDVDLSSAVFRGAKNITATGASKGLSLTGNALGNTIVGSAGNEDTLYGGAGNDILTGGASKDVFKFGKGDGVDHITDLEAVDVVNFYNVDKADLTFTVVGNTLEVGIKNSTDKLVIDTWNADKAAGFSFVANGSAFNVYGVNGSNEVAYKPAGLSIGTTAEDTVVVTSGTNRVDLGIATQFQSVENIDNKANTFSNSVLRGNDANNVIEAATNPTITAPGATTATGDQLWGGLGNDTLKGGNGIDTFWYAKNQGNKEIYAGSEDIIKLYDVNAADVTYALSGTDLTVSFAGSTDKLTLKNWGASTPKFVTADKTTPFAVNVSSYGSGNLNYTKADGKTATFTGSAAAGETLIVAADAGANIIKFTNTDKYKNIENIDNSDNNIGGSVLAGDQYSNVITAAAGADFAGSLGDELFGGNGNANDTLKGGAGNDVYWYAPGQGQDLIKDAGNGDVVKLWTTNADDVQYAVVGGTLEITFKGDNQSKLTIENWVALDDADKPKFVTADQTTPFAVLAAAGGNVAYVKDAVLYGTAGNDTLVVTGGTDATTRIDLANYDGIENINNTGNTGTAGIVLRGDKNSNVIAASDNNDQLWGGFGDDTLIGHAAGKEVFWYSKGQGNKVVKTTGNDDVINLYNVNSADVQYKVVGTDLEVTITGSTDKLVIENWTTPANQPKFVTADKATPFVLATTTDAINHVVNYDANATVYYGTAATDTLLVTGNTAAKTRIDLANYTSIEDINNAANGTAGTVLRGNDKDNVITASSTVANDIWGGLGNDTLVAGANGVDTFWYAKNQGNKVIQTAKAADVINLYDINSADVKYTVSGNDLVVSFTGSTNTLTIQNWAANKLKFMTADKTTAFDVNTVGAADNNIAYSKTATLTGTDAVDTLVVGAGIVKDRIDLANYNSIENINNSTNDATGMVLRGNEKDNVITASNTHANDIWGGLGNDTLIAGTGAVDTFWYGKNQGNKVIQGAKATDIVYFNEANRADLSYAFSGNDLVVSAKGSTGTVTIQGWNDATSHRPTFKTADETTFTWNIGTDAGDALTAVATDYVYAGKGDDTITYNAAGAKLVDGGEGTNTILAGTATKIDLTDTTKFANIQNITGSATSTTLYGDAKDNVITAGGANDNIWGRGGNDTLVGGAGNDTFWFGKEDGNDLVQQFGAAGTDKVMLYTQGLQASDIKVGLANYNNDLTLTVGTSTLTIAGGATLVGASSKVFTMADGSTYDVKQNADLTYSLK